MATVSDLTTTPLSGLNHIDALLDIGPDWNFLTLATANTIYYTFSTSSGNEADTTGQEAFSVTQQTATRTAFSYLEQITGIKFVETAVGTNAQIHLANLDIEGSTTTGLCSWHAPYTYGSGNVLVDYKPNAYVYLDNVQWRAQNQNLMPGTEGYETLLHELGHALGLKHPFEDTIQLPAGQDSTTYSLMSYNRAGGPHTTFSSYDIAALDWLYGRDGLGGALGINSTSGGRYITGTPGADRLNGTGSDDVLAGLGGNDIIVGGAGNDTVKFAGLRNDYVFTEASNGDLVGSHATLGTIMLSSIEQLSFGDVTVQRASIDITPPAAPVMAVSKNAAGYISTGSTPVISGSAEANSVVRVYAGDKIVAETSAGASGIWSVVGSAFSDGQNHTIRATATDAAGNVSPFSATTTFSVDALQPVAPTSSVTLASGSNQPLFQGNGEADTTIYIVRVTDSSVVAKTVVNSNGTWAIDSAILPNGEYLVGASSEDVAGNATSAETRLQFSVNSALNIDGSATADRYTPGAGNNAIDGKGGLDIAVYAGSRAGFTIERGVYGVTVRDNTGALGTDNLVNVERVQFGDTMVALDVEGGAGQIYRLYRAAFDREPDKAGLAYWINAYDKGFDMKAISAFFLADKEAQALYAQDPSDAYFVTKLYAHVLHRPAEGAGFDYWVNGLKQVGRDDVLAFFSESPENQAQVIGSITNGIEYPLATA